MGQFSKVRKLLGCLFLLEKVSFLAWQSAGRKVIFKGNLSFMLVYSSVRLIKVWKPFF
jgi:hypothetical protein